MSEYVMEYDGWAEGIPICEYLKVRDTMHSRKREEIVRCRDCRYSSYDNRWCYRQTNADALSIRPDGFCAWGERRDA